MKRKLPLLFIVGLVFAYVLYFNSKTVIYMGKSDVVLKNHKYNSKEVYIIRFQAPFTKFERCQLNKNKDDDLSVPKETEFFI